MTISKILSIALVILMLSPLCASASTDGNRVDILPRKILLEDRGRSADITVLNLGKRTGVIRMSLISYKQDETGKYIPLDKPLNPAFDPEKIVRFSPKQFSLPPSGRQKVRVSVQRPADLPDGEYRFHVKAMSYDTDDVDLRNEPQRGSSLSLKTNISVVIPVVVRKGALVSTAKIENVFLNGNTKNEYGAPTLEMDIVRTGTAGVMGVVRGFWEVPGQEPKQIAVVSNMNVFSESPKRRVVIPINEIPKGSGNLRVIYTDEMTNKAVIDEVVLQR